MRTRASAFFRHALHDPDRVILRRALRVAVVSPTLFAITGFGFDLPTVALFASFGSFCLLAMADLGGPLAHRFFGYLVLTVIGAALIAVGTPLAHWTAVAAVAMAVVGFAVRFAGVLGGYYAASGMALTLSFVLAVALPTVDSPLPERLLGWAVGGLVAAVAAVALWPAQERRAIREAMTAACDALADFVDALVAGADDTTVARLEADAAGAVEQAEARFHNAPYRPSGPSAHDRALLAALRHLAWLRDVCSLVRTTRPVDAADAELLASSSAHLRACGAALTGGAVVSLADEVDVRARHLEALVASVGDGRHGAASGAARLDQSFAARALSFAVLSLSSDVDAAVGHRVEDTGDTAAVSPPRRSAESMIRTAWGTMAAHLRLDSVRFRDAVRVGVGLGVAVAIALAGGLPHAFWVALGTLSVLRSNAMSTGYTVVQSIVGTILGFALAAGLVSVTHQDWFLWALLPVTVFLAAYTPSAVHFVVGQASFTIFVVVLFNLLVPQGWRTGLDRLQDIVIGATVSLVVSVVLWPRGASAQLRAASSAAIAVGGRYVADAVASRLGRAGGAEDDVMDRSRRDARDAGRRAAEAYITFLSERGRRRLPLDVAGELLSFGLLVDLSGQALESIPPTPSADGPYRAAAEQLTVEAAELAGHLATLHDLATPPEASHLEQLEQRDGEAITACLAQPPGDAAIAVVHLAWMSAWLRHVWRLTGKVAPSAEQAAAPSSARPWWR